MKNIMAIEIPKSLESKSSFFNLLHSKEAKKGNNFLRLNLYENIFHNFVFELSTTIAFEKRPTIRTFYFMYETDVEGNLLTDLKKVYESLLINSFEFKFIEENKSSQLQGISFAFSQFADEIEQLYRDSPFWVKLDNECWKEKAKEKKDKAFQRKKKYFLF